MPLVTGLMMFVPGLPTLPFLLVSLGLLGPLSAWSADPVPPTAKQLAAMCASRDSGLSS